MTEEVVPSVEAQPVAVSERVFPRIWPSLGWILLYFVLQIVFSVIAFIVAMAIDPELFQRVMSKSPDLMKSSAMAAVAMWGVIGSGGLVLLVLWFNLRKEGRAAQIGLFSAPRISWPMTIAWGVGLVLASLAFNWAYSTYVIPGIDMQAGVKDLLKALSSTPLNIALKFLVVAGIAPAVEELLFRGYLQSAFSQRMNGHGAVWLAAFVFSLVHMQPYAIPALMTLGAAFGYLYQRTGSLRTNIALHMINNAAALLLS
jgi:uncharacterized protein